MEDLKIAEQVLATAVDNLEHGQVNEAIKNLASALLVVLLVLKKVASK
jgi:hypothetical protein